MGVTICFCFFYFSVRLPRWIHNVVFGGGRVLLGSMSCLGSFCRKRVCLACYSVSCVDLLHELENNRYFITLKISRILSQSLQPAQLLKQAHVRLSYLPSNLFELRLLLYINNGNLASPFNIIITPDHYVFMYNLCSVVVGFSIFGMTTYNVVFLFSASTSLQLLQLVSILCNAQRVRLNTRYIYSQALRTAKELSLLKLSLFVQIKMEIFHP